MKTGEFIKLIMEAANSQSEIHFLYGQKELELVQLEGTVPFDKGETKIVLCLDEKRDLSDPEKHEG